MGFKYKHKDYGDKITEREYRNLTRRERRDYREIDSSGDFIVSAAIGAATDSALLGGLLGGDLLGGVVGDLLDGDLFD